MRADGSGGNQAIEADANGLISALCEATGHCIGSCATTQSDRSDASVVHAPASLRG